MSNNKTKTKYPYGYPYSRHISKKSQQKKFEIIGYDYLEKTVKPHHSTAGRIYLPVSWVGRRVAIIIIE